MKYYMCIFLGIFFSMYGMDRIVPLSFFPTSSTSPLFNGIRLQEDFDIDLADDSTSIIREKKREARSIGYSAKERELQAETRSNLALKHERELSLIEWFQTEEVTQTNSLKCILIQLPSIIDDLLIHIDQDFKACISLELKVNLLNRLRKDISADTSELSNRLWTMMNHFFEENDSDVCQKDILFLDMQKLIDNYLQQLKYPNIDNIKYNLTNEKKQLIRKGFIKEPRRIISYADAQTPLSQFLLRYRSYKIYCNKINAALNASKNIADIKEEIKNISHEFPIIRKTLKNKIIIDTFAATRPANSFKEKFREQRFKSLFNGYSHIDEIRYLDVFSFLNVIQHLPSSVKTPYYNMLNNFPPTLDNLNRLIRNFLEKVSFSDTALLNSFSDILQQECMKHKIWYDLLICTSCWLDYDYSTNNDVPLIYKAVNDRMYLHFLTAKKLSKSVSVKNIPMAFPSATKTCTMSDSNIKNRRNNKHDSILNCLVKSPKFSDKKVFGIEDHQQIPTIALSPIISDHYCRFANDSKRNINDDEDEDALGLISNRCPVFDPRSMKVPVNLGDQLYFSIFNGPNSKKYQNFIGVYLNTLDMKYEIFHLLKHTCLDALLSPIVDAGFKDLSSILINKIYNIRCNLKVLETQMKDPAFRLDKFIRDIRALVPNKYNKETPSKKEIEKFQKSPDLLALEINAVFSEKIEDILFSGPYEIFNTLGIYYINQEDRNILYINKFADNLLFAKENYPIVYSKINRDIQESELHLLNSLEFGYNLKWAKAIFNLTGLDYNLYSIKMAYSKFRCCF